MANVRGATNKRLSTGNGIGIGCGDQNGLKQVMEHDSVIRKRVKEMSEKGKKSLMNGGSLYSSLAHFIDHI
ncbi:hypothetical protein ACE6H2_011436 [Prunus campanulata]